MHRTSGSNAILLALALASPAAGGLIFVPKDFPTIQAAIDAAADGTTIVVSPGVYHEAIDFGGKAVIISSEDVTEPEIIAATVIDASGLDASVVLFVNGETATSGLRGLTLTGGSGSADRQREIVGGGIRIFQSSPSIEDCRLVANTAPEDGAAIYIDEGSPTIVRCLFLDNAAGDDGGAIAIRGAGGMQLDDSVFVGNTAAETGGAIRIRSGGAEIAGCVFQGNDAGISGGALHVHPEDAFVSMTSSTLCGNLPAAIDGPVSGTGNRFLASCDADTDGDGLHDLWEIVGIPYEDANGAMQYYVLDADNPPDGTADADPDRKNLFVELDRMVGLSFGATAVGLVEDAFFLSPVEGNPDGSIGIDLFIVVDDGDLPFVEVTGVAAGDAYVFPAGAAADKAARFGTQAERSSPAAASLLAAKAKAYRYALLYNKASPKIGGLAEVGGNDFIVWIGSSGGDLALASKFMHELGHCLGLRHGGGDGVNGKPNYPSIMNYTLAYRQPWNQSFWRLDYSRQKLDTLKEDDLDESVSTGSGGDGEYQSFFMPFHNVVPRNASCHPPEIWGESLVSYADLDPSILTDYSLDCDEDDETVIADLNFVPGSALPGSLAESAGQTLDGFNDWANIVLKVSAGGGDFASTLAPPDELTEEQLAYMVANFPPPPCAADLDGNGAVDGPDVGVLLGAWGPCLLCPADLDANDVVDSADLGILLASWGPCR